MAPTGRFVILSEELIPATTLSFTDLEPMAPLPLLIVAPPGPGRDQIVSALHPRNPEVLDAPDAFLARDSEEWGILILGPGLPAEAVLDLLGHQSRSADPWVLLMVEEGPEDFMLRPISLGPRVSPQRVLEVSQDPAEEGPLLDLHWTLRVVARARHDLNNPLTSGLAEAQLLLMDEHPPEVKESLETIQEQFRRLRDMVADLSRLRVSRTDPGTAR